VVFRRWKAVRKSLVAKLLSAQIRAIYQDREGSLWSACLPAVHAGLQASEFECYTEKEGLASNTVFALYEDWEGSLWIAIWLA